MLRHIAAAAFLLTALTSRPSFADVAGPATVIDGDTVIVAGERVRLQGIDAPELHQDCTAYGQEWACGRTSAEWLKEVPARSASRVCRPRARPVRPVARGLLPRRQGSERADRT